MRTIASNRTQAIKAILDAGTRFEEHSARRLWRSQEIHPRRSRDIIKEYEVVSVDAEAAINAFYARACVSPPKAT